VEGKTWCRLWLSFIIFMLALDFGVFLGLFSLNL
jgi:hypothetical protein